MVGYFLSLLVSVPNAQNYPSRTGNLLYVQIFTNQSDNWKST